MEHITDTRIEQSEPTAVTLGNFDGLHQGHRSLINLTKQFAEEEGLKSVVFTFSPHPMFVFQRKEDFALIVDPSEKKFQMEQMGIDIYIEYPFDMNFAAMDPEDFAVKLIFEKLKCQVLVVGEDYRFGKGAAGNYEMLKRLGAERGIKVIGVPKVLHGDERVSSSRIRRRLLEKNLEEANRMLTVPYFILGTVKEGKKLGRTIGFPTVNIDADAPHGTGMRLPGGHPQGRGGHGTQGACGVLRHPGKTGMPHALQRVHHGQPVGCPCQPGHPAAEGAAGCPPRPAGQLLVRELSALPR